MGETTFRDTPIHILILNKLFAIKFSSIYHQHASDSKKQQSFQSPYTLQYPHL